MADDRTRTPFVLDRRTALTVPAATTVVVGSAGALTACGGGSSTGSATSPVEVATGDVPVGGGVVQDGVVVTQPTEGEFHAFDPTCPHQGCAVSSVEGASIVCPCHGSTFDAATGEPTGGPAESGLTAKEITASGSTLTVS